MSRAPGIVLLAFLLLAAGAPAAPPDVPGSFSYQGVLLDTSGQPQSGPVDLTIRLWDAALGGVLLYKQERNNTILVDGVFTIVIGPTGVGTDVPTNPLATNLVSVLTTDLGALAEVWLELSVDGSLPLARNKLQSVPFAVRSESSASADTADTATNLQTGGGVSTAILDAIWLHHNFDGGPPNTDPSEGTGDTDLDSIPNFVDDDNDNDGLTDSVEVAQGSNINLVTPTLTGFSGDGSNIQDVSLSATGTNFDPALTTTVGGGSVAPSGITSTAFDFVAPRLPAGSHPVVVTLPNGESDTLNLSYSFTDPGPPTFLSIPIALATAPIEAMALGADRLLIHSDDDYAWDVVDDGQIVLGPAVEGILAPGSTADTVALAWDSTGRLGAVHRNNGTGMVEVFLDADLSGQLEFGERTAVELADPGGVALAFDASDRLVGGYVRPTVTVTQIRVFQDADGDGTIAAGEIVTAESWTGAVPSSGEIAVDSASRVAYVTEDPTADLLRVVWDRSGDGDFDDTVSGNPESFAPAGSISCLGADFDANDALVVVYGSGGALTLARDTSGDGDFADAGETVVLAPLQLGNPSSCDVDASGPGVAVSATDGTHLELFLDRNADGDFDEFDDRAFLGTGVSAPIAVERLGNGEVIVLAPQGIVEDPL